MEWAHYSVRASPCYPGHVEKHTLRTGLAFLGKPFTRFPGEYRCFMYSVWPAFPSYLFLLQVYNGICYISILIRILETIVAKILPKLPLWGFDPLVFSTLWCGCCLSAWLCGAKGVNVPLGKSGFVISVAEITVCMLHSVFPPLPSAQAVFFFKKGKKKGQSRNILYSMHCYFKSNQSRFLLFLSLWLVNSEKEVQFECSDDGEDLYRQIFFFFLLWNVHT